MSFIDAVLTCFAKSFSISGRASRAEYWWFFLFRFIILLIMVLSVYISLISEAYSYNWGTTKVIGIIYLLTILPGVSSAVRRLHDVGISGNALFVLVLPSVFSFCIFSYDWFISIVVFLSFYGMIAILLLSDSEANNKYGPTPKSEMSQIENINL